MAYPILKVRGSILWTYYKLIYVLESASQNDLQLLTFRLPFKISFC